MNNHMLKLIVLWVGLGGREMGRVVVARGVQKLVFSTVSHRKAAARLKIFTGACVV